MAWFYMGCQREIAGMKQKETKPRKQADLRLIVPPELADQLRERAHQARRTMQAQAITDLERGMRQNSP